MKKYLLPFLIVLTLGIGLVIYSEKNWDHVSNNIPENKAQIKSTKIRDSLWEKLSEELLNHEWIKPGDSLIISEPDTSGNSLAIFHFVNGEKVPANSWIYYIQDLAIVDTINNREFMIGPTITKDDRKRLQQYNPANP